MIPQQQQQALPKLPDTTPQAPVFSTQPTGARPGRKPQTAAYIPNASPSVANAGYKQLIGQ